MNHMSECIRVFSRDMTTGMSIRFENKMDMDRRFAKRNDIEYSVFSIYPIDADDEDEWLAVTKPDCVLIHKGSLDTLRNRHIEWVFDDKNMLIACEIHSDDE